ncbi:MAG: hypothetical protein OEZ06_25450 [Myxococcales bacterium]|nr:hypothetical protein [Myxococcales bacterium]
MVPGCRSTAGFGLRILARGLWIWGLLLLLLGPPRQARADSFDSFQSARAAYEALNYELSVELFGSILEGVKDDDRRPVVIESRKYLGASYLFVGKPEAARSQFERLLEAVPDYVLDPLAFPDEVQRAFADTRAALQAARLQAAQQREKEAATAQAESARERREHNRKMSALLALARTERVEERRSRWIAALPFGLGQFHNGHDGLGLTLAVSQTLLLGTGIATYVSHEQIPRNPREDERSEARTYGTVLRWTNNISLGLFAAIALTGIVDAQLRFRPIRSFERERRLPTDLDGLELSLDLHPGGATIGGRF